MKTTSRDYHHGNLRQALLDAAIAHIENAGEVSFTMRELAKTLGVSSAAPFRHFATKRALLAALAEGGYEKLAAMYDELDVRHADDPAECFRSKGIAYLTFALANKASYRAMYDPELNDRSEYPTLQAAAARVFASVLATVQLCQARSLLGDFSAEQISMTIWSASHGFASLLINGQLKELGVGSSKKAAIEAAQRVGEVIELGMFKHGA